jgi:hypothetical protein
VAPDPDEPAASKLDAVIDAAHVPENEVLAVPARVVRWVGPLFALCAVALLPWTVYLAETLPARQVSPNYGAAWTGFDVLLIAVLASTAYLALRRSRYLAITSASAATMLVIDAWFDCMTTPADQRWESLLLAAVIELPLAGVCVWLSYHTEHLSQQRLELLLPGRRR